MIPQKNPFIWTKSNTLSKEFCRSVIQKYEKDPRKYEGTTMAGINRDAKISTDLIISNTEEWKNEDKVFLDSLQENVQIYCDYLNKVVPNYNGVHVFNDSKNIIDTGYQIQRTRPGEFYNWHNDYLFNGSYSRCLTYIWYLNDIENDGETEFYDGTLVKPEEGKMLIFPATWNFMHQGKKPKNEVKYICTGWISHGPM